MKTFLHAKFLFPCLHSLAIAIASLGLAVTLQNGKGMGAKE